MVRAQRSPSRDHNATSYSTETTIKSIWKMRVKAEIITLRAIALKPKHPHRDDVELMWSKSSRDHNATSYSTETTSQHDQTPSISAAEIITLRAIALKLHASWLDVFARCCRDHNATSYSTETSVWTSSRVKAVSRDHNATSYSTETDFRNFAPARVLLQRS